MGSWGITMRQSDQGLDWLDFTILPKLKETNFAAFSVSEAIELLRKDILDVIKRANRGCSPEDMKFYVEENFPREFAHAAMLIAECLADYYRTGELVLYDYVKGRSDPIEYHVKKFVVTKDDLELLLKELKSVQEPEHEVYDSWIEDETREKWLVHIRSVHQLLSTRMTEMEKSAQSEHPKGKRKKHANQFER